MIASPCAPVIRAPALPDDATPARADPTPAGDAAASPAGTAARFGRLLAERMDAGGAIDIAPMSGDARPATARTNGVAGSPASDAAVALDLATADRVASGVSSGATVGVADATAPSGRGAPTASLVDDAGGAIVTVSLAGQPVVAPGSDDRPDRTGVSKADATDTPDADAIGDTLAAQMALASQWAPRPDATPVAAPTTAVAGTRGTASPATATVAIADAPSNTAATATATTMVAATTARTPGSLSLPRSSPTAPVTPASHDATGPVPIDDARAATPAPTGWTVAFDRARSDNGRSTRATQDAAAAIAEAVGPRADGVARAPGDVALPPPVSNATALPVAPSAAAAAVPATIHLHEPVGTPAWAHDVGQATLRMAANDLQTASLRLHPENLGPVDVQLRIEQGVASLSFNAAHQDTRQALEASRTTLDQMFAAQGLTIGDCAVGDGSSPSTPWSRPDADPATAGGARGGPGRAATADGDVVSIVARRASAPGRVDTFA